MQSKFLTPISNSYDKAYQARGQTLRAWGKDQTAKIEYTFNNQGFRSYRDFDWQPDIAFFGNSIVFGIGVDYKQIMVNQFSNSQNYGLAGEYFNWHSVENLKRFIDQGFKAPHTRVVFFWVDRFNKEHVPDLVEQVNGMCENVLHISSGMKYPGCRNLMSQIDTDVSGTHPGPRTHDIWAKTIRLLLK